MAADVRFLRTGASRGAKIKLWSSPIMNKRGLEKIGQNCNAARGVRLNYSVCGPAI